MIHTEKSLKELFIPIFLELLFLTFVGTLDTIMLTYVGDNAVGGVGTANTYLGIFLISFSIISSGVLAVMTQYIGYGKPGVAIKIRNIGGACNAILGVILSVILVFYAAPILEAMQIAPALYEHAKTYTIIVGGSCILNALIPIANSYLRAFGYTKEPLICTIVSNLVNLVFNAVFLYIFQMGVAGVALATVIARIVNFIMVLVYSYKKIHIPKDDSVSNGLLLKQILSIGFPAAMETSLYNVAMTLVMIFLNLMDEEGINVTARSYANQIVTFSFIAGAALAQANAIITGWRIGEKQYDECLTATNKTARFGIFTALGFSLLSALLGSYLITLFTQDKEIIQLVQIILVIDIFLELGRVTNLIYGNALKTCGDAVYTVCLAVFFMYLFAVLGTYVLGLKLGWMVIGAWIAMAADECLRSIFMCIRWNSRKWKKKVFVK